jgi:hypothetical protein
MKIEIPKELQHLERDVRGLPIPYVVVRDKSGKPHFKVNDADKSLYCLKNKVCHICGNLMLKTDLWVIGGHLSAFAPNGAFSDGAVHKACGMYALKVCPYFSNTSYKATGAIDLKAVAEVTPVLFDPTQTTKRLQFMVFAKIKGYSLHTRFEFDTILIPNKPYIKIEYWKDGKQITLQCARELLINDNELDILPKQ